MPRPQPAIFAVGARSQHHLQLDLLPDATPAAILTAARTVRESSTTISGVNVVIGFAADAWARVAGDDVPLGLGRFEAIEGSDGVEMPADQHDIWLWFHAATPDVVFDAARSAADTFGAIARVASEQPVFTYQRSQDITGFEDGTENPPLDEAVEIAVIPEDRPGAGGSIAFVQRWVHDLAGFRALPPREQEAVMGRTLDGSEELPEDERPQSSHVSRVVVEGDDGEELAVFRRSSAFGGVLEHGLFFVAFSPDVERVERMLRRMAGLDDGIVDAVTRFSRSTGAAWYFAPPVHAFTT